MTVEEFLEFREQRDQNELEHYGVLGMKWGVRKDPQRAYDRANKKLAKLDRKATKAGQKAEKSYERSLAGQAKANASRALFRRTRARQAAHYIRKSNRAYFKAEKKVKKAERWYKSMENSFRNVKISDLKADSSYTELGKKYANSTISDMMKYNTGASMVQLMNYYDTVGRRR